MMMAELMSSNGNLHLLKEKIENAKETISNLIQEQTKYQELEQTLKDLPKKIQHPVMVPLGKRAMMPGQIYRTNEVLCHLGDDYYTWQSVDDSMEILKRKQKNLVQQIKAQEEQHKCLVDCSNRNNNNNINPKNPLLEMKTIYDQENIKEIQETEEENEFYESQVIQRVTEEDIEEYFEIEKEEENKMFQQEQTLGSWEEMMQRMEALEILEEEKTNDTIEKQVNELKGKGNQAFRTRKFQQAINFYTKAIQLEPINQILYGNRSAAYQKLFKFKEALEDANKAIDLDINWVKGHYRKGCTLEALKRYQEAAQAFETAYEICPTDTKLEQLIQEMKTKANQQQKPISSMKPASTTSIKPPSNSNTMNSIYTPSPFNGDILERPSGISPGFALNSSNSSSSSSGSTSNIGSSGRRSRFLGNQERGGDVVTLEPVGEAVPVKRVSKFKAARAAFASTSASASASASASVTSDINTTK